MWITWMERKRDLNGLASRTSSLLIANIPKVCINHFISFYNHSLIFIRSFIFYYYYFFFLSFLLISEKALEKKILTSETSKLMAQSNNLRSETIHLERRIYELLSARTALDSERRMLSEKIERINALVRNLR